MAERACVKRLQKEYRALCKEPVSNIVACPSLNDILEWHYVLEGSEGTPFAGGFYYGKIKFPPEYPFKPPSISMTTPNGRFAQDRKICLSMSDCKFTPSTTSFYLFFFFPFYRTSSMLLSVHPETWNPMWSVSSILTGLLSFMMDNSPTTGSISTTEDVKKQLARSSLAYNCKNPAFRKLFPEYVEKYNNQQATKDALETRHPLPRKEDFNLNHKAAAEINGEKPGGNGENANIARRQRKKIPLWLMFVLITVFSSVMALPLYQL